jgi:hypothetical protein
MRIHPPSFVPLALVLGALAPNSPIAQSANATSWITNSPMSVGREWHTATLLPDGKVLVTGGVTNYAAPSYLTTATAECYDPNNGKWLACSAMSRVRALHTATLLPNGKVLVAGG